MTSAAHETVLIRILFVLCDFAPRWRPCIFSDARGASSSPKAASRERPPPATEAFIEDNNHVHGSVHDRAAAAAEVAEAERLRDALVAEAQVGERSTARIAYLLADYERRGFTARSATPTSAESRAVKEKIVGTRRKARELIALVKQLADAPRIQRDFVGGALPWTKARAAISLAKRQGEARALDKASKLTSRALEAEARRGAGAPVQRPDRRARWRFEQAALVDAFLKGQVKAARDDGRALSEGEPAPCARCKEERGPRGGRSASCCARPARARRRRWRRAKARSSSRRPPSSRPCATRRSWTSAAAPRVTKTVPPRTWNYVMARDKHRCRVPGCPNTQYLQVHREPCRADVGHDAERVHLVPCAPTPTATRGASRSAARRRPGSASSSQTAASSPRRAVCRRRG